LTGVTFSVTYAVAANDFCAHTVQDAGISGSLSPYKSAADALSSSSTSVGQFIVGQGSYFAAPLTVSVTGLTLSDSVVTAVSVQTGSGSPKSLTAGVMSISGQYQSYTTDAQRPAFGFTIDSGSIDIPAAGSLAADAELTASVSATITVIYTNLQSAERKVTFAASPRFLPQASTPLTLGTQISVSQSASSSASSASGSSSMVAIVAGVVGGCMFIVILAAVVVYRRRSAAATAQKNSQQPLSVMQVYVPSTGNVDA